MIEVEDLQMDEEDGWSYSMPPSLESLPLKANDSNGNQVDKEGDEESIISELEDTPTTNGSKQARRPLKVDTNLSNGNKLNQKQLPSLPIDIQKQLPVDNPSGVIITTPPKQMAMPSVSSMGSSYSASSITLMMKSTPADPLTTVEEVHNKESPAKASFNDSSSLDEKSDNSSANTKLSNTIYQLQQTISGNSIQSKEDKDEGGQEVDLSVTDSTAEISKVDSDSTMKITSDSNASFFSSFRNVAQSMLQSPSGSHVRTTSDTVINSSVTDPTTPLQHRRTISTASSSFVPTVSEEGEFKLVENGDHSHPDIISYRRSKRPKSSSVSSVNSVMKSPTSATDTASPVTPSSLGFDKNLYIDEFYKDTQYRYATLKRNADFHNLFVSIPIDDRLLDDFSCALSREILIQGRIYISEHYIGFNSNILGWVTNLVVPFSDVVSIEKKLTAGLFNNGIVIETKETKHYFATFISRDATFKFFNTVWEKVEKSPSETSSIFKNRKMNLKYKADGIGLLEFDDASDNEVKETLDDAIEFNKAISIDGDTPRRVSDTDIFDSAVSQGIAIKPDCGYEIEGPSYHLETDINYNAKENGETELFIENINAPPGLVFNILFGENIQFHKHLMEMSDGSDFTPYSKFEDKDGKLARAFTYSKALGYSIGPKSTKVNVTETIEHKDYDSNINILTTSVTPDVPSGNVFSVNTRYILAWGANNTTNFQLSYFVKWTGKSWIKGMIESQTLSGQKQVATLLLKELKLKLDEIVTTTVTTSPIPLETVETKSSSSLIQKFEEEVEEVESVIQSIGQEIRASVPRWLAIIIIFILSLQFYTISIVRTNNSLVQRQIEITENLLRAQIVVDSNKKTIKDRINNIIFNDENEDDELNRKIEDDLTYYKKHMGQQ